MLSREYWKQKFAPITQFIEKYERHAGAVAILLGFIVDSLTLYRPDQFWGNVIFIGYFLVSAVGIILLVAYHRRGQVMPAIILAVTQFCFGNLAGGMLVLYGRSGTFEGNYLFFLILGGFVIGNEFLRNYYAKLRFYITVWYFLLISYFVLVLPIAFGRVGDVWFVLSTIVSLLAVALFVALLYLISREHIKSLWRGIWLQVVAVFVCFNILYFLNIIPPVPLALRSIGIYHTVARQPDGNYKVTFEKPRFYEFFRGTSKKYSKDSSGGAYCFSSVFAPVKIGTAVFHNWEKYNETAGEWQSVARISFAISGGRDGGYRGYSFKSNLSAGKWRCSVETARGSLIGRTSFNVLENNISSRLVEKEI